MKIIFIEAVQDYGGARISTVELAERLSSYHDVSMIDFYGSCGPFVDAVKKSKMDFHIVDKRDHPYIINTSSSSFVKLINLIAFIPHLLKIRRKLIKLIKDLSPDFIVVNNSKVLSPLLLFPNKKFKTIFFARGWFIPSQITRLDRVLFKVLIDRFACVSAATKQALFCGGLTTLENSYVVQNAISESKLSKEVATISRYDEDTKVILHAGGFLKDKGQLVSLEMARILKSRNVNFKLVLAGIVYKGSESELFHNKVVDLINSYQLNDVVEIVKNKSSIISYFNACDILIHPSETEGLPRVIMEAMILKKPVIANAVGGVSDYILNEFTGFLPLHNSAKEYAQCVELIIADEKTTNNITQNAYKLISTCFTEEKQLASLNKVFES